LQSIRIIPSALLFAAVAAAQPYVISTLAGGALLPTPPRGVDLPIGNLRGVAVDDAGNVYFSSLNSVFKVDPNGALTRIAGNSRPGYSGDGGPATDAQLNAFGLAVDGAGNLFIATGNGIRRVSPSGIIVTVAGGGSELGDGGPAADAQLNAYGVAVDTAGNLFVAGGSRIRKISAAGIITTIAGNGVAGTSGDGGPAVNAQVNGPGDVAVDRAGNVYLPDNQRIRKISPSGIITTVAGNGQCCFTGDGGQATRAELDNPRGVAVDGMGNLFIVEAGLGHIRKVSPSGIITTVAGNGAYCNGPPGSLAIGDGGLATAALFCFGGMGRMAVDSAGNLFIGDTGNQRVRKVSTDKVIHTVAGSGTYVCCSGGAFSGDGGPSTSAQLNAPSDVAVDAAGDVFIADRGNGRIRRVSTSGIITTVAGGGTSGLGSGAPATNTQLTAPEGIAVDSAGNLLATDATRILRISPDGIISEAAGNGTFGSSGDGGPATSAQLRGPHDVAVDSAGDLFIVDSGNQRIRKVTPDGIISTAAGNGKAGFSGDDGPAVNAALSIWDDCDGPVGDIAVDGAGGLFLADTDNGRVREISPSGIITTVAGGGSSLGDGGPATSAQLSPSNVALDGAGNLFIADSYYNRIRKVSRDGTLTTVAGNGPWGDQGGYSGDGGPAISAALSGPHGIAVDGAGNVYVADSGNNAVRVLRPAKSPVLIGAVVDAASQRIEALSPGKIVVIYGAGLGPTQLAQNQASNGVFSTQFSGTSVSFNGIAAPILYTSATQVAATVPAAFTGTTAQVLVSYQGQVSNVVAVTVAPAAPSLFTRNQTGAGQAAAINADGTINTALNAVKIGGYISLYATGWNDSKLPAAAIIGGIPATVQYSGQAPGQPAGLMQINVQIPNGVQPGGYVPVVLKVGDSASADGAVWIAVSAN
jgi:uncharacterized protein (TIGR03437 family)